MHDHRLIDERSLAFDRLTADKIRQNPALIQRARETIQRWLVTASPRLRPALLEWQQILDGPQEELMSMLHRTDEHATRLRQSSPFAGIFTNAERTAILREFEQRESSAT